MSEKREEERKEIRSLLQIFGRERALDVVRKATDSIRKALEEGKDKVILPLSPKARAIKEQCVSFGPPGATKLATLFSIILDEDIEINSTQRKLPYHIFACVIPNIVVASHDYKIGEPVFLFVPVGDKVAPCDVRCIKLNGQLGKNLLMQERVFDVPSDEKVIEIVNALFDGFDDF